MKRAGSPALLSLITLITLVLFAVSSWGAGHNQAPSINFLAARPPAVPEVSLTKSIFGNGEQVQAVVRSPAQVIVGSDLSRSSRQFDIFGTRTIDLGPISTDGYSIVTVDDGANKTALQVLFLKQGANFEAVSRFVPIALADIGPAAELKPAIEKYLANVTASRTSRAYAAAKAKFPSENAVALGNTVVICLITIPTGMWVACAATVGGVAVDFMFKLNEELIDVMGPTKDRILNAAEANLLKTWMGAAKLIPDAVKLIFGGDKVEKVFSALKLGTGGGEIIIDNADGKFAFKTSGDFFKKYEVILKLK